MLISPKDKMLHIELHGKEQLWSLKAKIDTPLEIIESISFEEKFQDWRKWELRMPGTHAPKLLIAGSYWTEEGWDFMYIKRPIGFVNPLVQNVLVIKTTQEKFKRIIISVDEKDAKKVMNWWKKNSKKK
jgi:hypothetical protein